MEFMHWVDKELYWKEESRIKDKRMQEVESKGVERDLYENISWLLCYRNIWQYELEKLNRRID